MSRQQNKYTFKAVLIGKKESGKLKYLAKLINNKFDSQYYNVTPTEVELTKNISTFVTFAHKEIDHGNKRIRFQLWNTAGQEGFIPDISSSFREPLLFALFVDLSEENLMTPGVESESIQYLSKPIDLSEAFIPIPPLKGKQEPITSQCFVIFTKNDLAKENGIQLSEEQLQNLATQAMEAAQVPKENRIPGQFIVTSAKTGENIEETLAAFANALLPLPAPTLKAFVLPKTEESWWDRNFGNSEKEDVNPPQYENHLTF